VAFRLGPKGNGDWSRGLTSPARGLHIPRSNCRRLRSRTPEAETSKSRSLALTGESPIFPPYLCGTTKPKERPGSFRFIETKQGKLIVSEALGAAGVGSWKKRMPSCNGADTGSEFAGRESEQTSGRCLSARALGERFTKAGDRRRW
jgi:hypothetical protein